MNGWTTPKEIPDLAEGAIQVWRIDLDGSGSSDGSGRSRQETEVLLELSAGLLTSEERARALRMRAGGPRNEFVAGRGCLRKLLGAALHQDPRTVVLAVGEHGKPEMGVAAAPRIAFNVSHSRGLILLALSRAGAVGVDVEFVDDRFDMTEVAGEAFPPADYSRIMEASTRQDRLVTFYRAWTRREAVAKADGRGLTLSPEELSLGQAAFGSGESMSWLQYDAEGSRTYCVREIEAGSCHMAALAGEKSGAGVDLLRLRTSLLA